MLCHSIVPLWNDPRAILVWKNTTEGFGPIVLGVDPARGGGDKTGLIDRQGRRLGQNVCKIIDRDDLMAVAGEVQKIANDINPHLDSVLQAGADRITDQVNSSMAGAGRYGSGAHTGILADRLGEHYSRGLFNNYNTERGYQMNSAGQLFNYGQQAPRLAGILDDVDRSQAQLQLGTGQTRDQQEEAERQAEIRAAQWRAGIVSPIAGLGGTSNTTGTTETRQKKPTDWASVALGVGQLAAGMPPTAWGNAAGKQTPEMHQPSFWTPTVTRY